MVRPRRKRMSKSVKLDAALHALGLLGLTVEWHHCPPLGLRERTPDGGFVPDENDARYIVPLSREAHRAATVGNGATCADGDIHKIAKARRLSRDHEEFRARLLQRPAREERPKSKWPKRPFNRKRTTA